MSRGGGGGGGAVQRPTPVNSDHRLVKLPGLAKRRIRMRRIFVDSNVILHLMQLFSAHLYEEGNTSCSCEHSRHCSILQQQARHEFRHTLSIVPFISLNRPAAFKHVAFNVRPKHSCIEADAALHVFI